ncbi:MAG: Hsp33 family molecular chaperone HslO [Negativicoccus succinicivorans]|uniref:Hsp33 family molecular chaperone HslO n=1 Tax=Negativicoccus succinicivorans TaxID=620903 RepID=UPI0029104E09|nr:Hsp33 family molecular chaperone HslO [Negativicoccus succinicivorans]MDU5396317.1 Hsp33 family molecular chaperone HslO [Negativicoccus succinicivorans]
MWTDSIKHYLAHEGLKISVAYTTSAVARARALHDLSPVAAAALGRAMTGALLLATDFKNQEGVSIRFDGDGPLGKIFVDAYETNRVRGYVENGQVDLPLNEHGKLDVGQAVGQGMLYVTRYSLLRQPYQSAIEIHSGEIAEDLAYYLTLSEQIPSAVSLGVMVSRGVQVLAAGGILVEAMPDHEEEALQQIEANLAKLGPITNAMRTHTEEEIIEILSQGLHVDLLAEKPVLWECTCSSEKFLAALKTIPKEDQEALLQEDKTELVCHYCERKYVFTKDELAAAFAEKEEPNA